MKAILFRFAAVLIGLAIVILFSEVALRLFAPSRWFSISERSLFCRFDHDLGWAPLENVTSVQKSADLTAMVHQNQFGLRGPDDVQLEKTSGKKRMLVLGDSYVWGFGVTQSRIFSATEVHGTKEEILNFGVSGYGTDQEYLLYLLEGTKFAVDEVVVALTPYNDIANNLASKQYHYLKPYFTLEAGQLVLHDDHVRDSRLRKVADSLKRYSRLVDLLCTFVDVTLNPAKAKDFAPAIVTENDRAGIDLTVAILEKLRDAVVAHNARFYVIFIPYKPFIERHLPNNHPFVPLIAAGLTHAGVSYREPYPEFLKAAMAGSDPFNGIDNHFSAEGHALLAKFLTNPEQAGATVNYYAHKSPMPDR